MNKRGDEEQVDRYNKMLEQGKFISASEQGGEMTDTSNACGRLATLIAFSDEEFQITLARIDAIAIRDELTRLRADNASLRSEIEKQKKKPCVHDRARDYLRKFDTDDLT